MTVALTPEFTTPLGISQPVQRALVVVEAHAFEASTELVYQREHISEYDRLDARRDGLVAALLGAATCGDTHTVRSLAPQVVAADRQCDEAVRHVDARRENAHGYTRRIASQIELTLTGRSAMGGSL